MLKQIKALPIGYSEVVYQSKRYGVIRTDFNEGRSYKIYAEELGGPNFISLNYYLTSSSEKLKPCEMPFQKVIDFLNEYKMYKVSKSLNKIAFGGGCHWCTEAVFQSLKGVEDVEQGFIASTDKNDTFSEAVIVHFDAGLISQRILIEIHLYTHNSTSYHSMRNKYRSAVYTFSEKQATEVQQSLTDLQHEFNHRLVTKVYPFAEFRPSEERFTNYYNKNPSKPFCKNHIDPKLCTLLSRFTEQVNTEKIGEVITS